MTGSVVTALLIVTKSLIVVLGGTITCLAVRAMRRTSSSALRSFAIGFGLLTIGGVVGGGLDRLVGIGGRYAILVQNLLTVLGLGVLMKSLYVDESFPTM